jgi:phosphatidylserine/phosphatidylglycerophosphate/cardiolipin synthase-like enzyme
MEEIITQLRLSIDDQVLSRSEKKSLKVLIGESPLDTDQLNFLRSKIYEIANEKATPENYPFILEWIKGANSVLLTKSTTKSDAFFSPGESCRNIIINQIMYAINKIDICVFTISDDRITNAIIEAHRRGKQVRVVTDNDKALDLGSDIAQLSQAGIPIRMDDTPNHMHHKFMIIDEGALITGSYNWTLSAAKYNHENVLLTTDGKLVKLFLKEFGQIWNDTKPYM